MSAETDLQTNAGLLVKILNEQKKFALSNTANYQAMEAAVLAALGTSYDAQPGPTNVLSAMRGSVFGFPGIAAAGIGSFLPAYGRILGIPDTDLATIRLKLFDTFGLSSRRVKTRAFTFGTPAAGTNIGTGTLIRLTKDRYDFAIETGSAEAKSALCVQDEHDGGTRHGELFELRGAAITKAMYPMPGQGAVVPIRALSINDSRSYIRNPGFDEAFDTTNGAPGWTVGSAWTNFAQSSTAFQDLLPSTATSYSLQFTASDSITQTFSANRLNWPRYTPMYAELRWQRLASATGTLKFKIGAIEVSVSIGSGTNGVWNVLRWPATAPTTNAWFDNWNVTDGAFTITVTSLAVGTVLVDCVVCAPYTNFDGTWYALVSGATPFLSGVAGVLGDSWTWTDSETGSIVQEWLARAFPGYYLPSATVASGNITWADPT